MTSRNKNGDDSLAMWELCAEILWSHRFAMNDINKSSGEAYIQSSNANVRVLLNLSFLADFYYSWASLYKLPNYRRH